jgi:hypothetical protein
MGTDALQTEIVTVLMQPLIEVVLKLVIEGRCRSSFGRSESHWINHCPKALMTKSAILQLPIANKDCSS